MSGERSPEFDEWIQRAKAVDVLEVARECGAQLKKAGANEWAGPCPSCGGSDRFSLNTREQIYNCRGSASNRGKDGGDVIAMVMHIQNLKFVEAVEFINKEPPPGRNDDRPARPVDDRLARERREDNRDRKLEATTAEQREFEENCRKSAVLWDAGEPIPGTLAQRYLERRGLRPGAHMLDNLRFVPDLPYYGFANKDTKELSELGEFPALIAAIRDVNMRLIGVHRIYIDRESHAKLLPPGDRARNPAKKAFGNVIGGCVWLGPVAPFVAIAEGIETALAYWQLGYSGECTVAAAVTLGNLFGKATGNVPHPTLPKRTVPNGVPDTNAPGVRLPPEVEEILVLGDGDSEKVYTRHCVLTAVERFTGENRKSFALFAPDGQDFNDVLLSQPTEAA